MTAAAEPTVPWTVGDEIRKARREARLKQDQLASAVGVSRPTVSKWERGESEPSISQFRAIVQATGATWLLRHNLDFRKVPFGLRRRSDTLRLVHGTGRGKATVARPLLLVADKAASIAARGV